MERRIWSIEGNRQKLDGGAMFGNAPRPVWERWSPPDDRHRIDLACRSLLVQEPDRWILFEAGIGAFFSPELRDRYGVVEDRHVLLDSLRAAGLEDEDIDVVVLSHLHFDHAGGLLAAWEEGAPPRLLFPRARYVVGRTAWERARAPHPRDRASFVPALNALLEASGRLEVVDGEISEVLGPEYRFHLSEGHTPGLLATEIPGHDLPGPGGGAHGGGPIVFASDLIPGRPWVHLPITMGYDRFPERLIDEKRVLLEGLLAHHGRLFFTHDPGCALATVTRDDKGRFGTTDERPTVAGMAV
jgi:glyoxylase-like metal-dependent hydrolase (beta-lactamase superfamily II)